MPKLIPRERRHQERPVREMTTAELRAELARLNEEVDGLKGHDLDAAWAAFARADEVYHTLHARRCRGKGESNGYKGSSFRAKEH